MVKQTVPHPYYSVIKRKNYWHVRQWILRALCWVKERKKEGKEKPISRDYILYDSIYITFLKWWNYRHGKQISGCRGSAREEDSCGYKRATPGIPVVMQLYLYPGGGYMHLRMWLKLHRTRYTQTNGCMNNWWSLNQVDELYLFQFLCCDIILGLCRCYHWGKLDKGYCFLELHENLQLPQKWTAKRQWKEVQNTSQWWEWKNKAFIFATISGTKSQGRGEKECQEEKL